MSDSLATRLSKFPLLSTVAMIPVIVFSLPAPDIVGIAGGVALPVLNLARIVSGVSLPVLNCAVLMEAGRNLCDEKSSALSKAFSLATCCLAIAGPSTMLLYHSYDPEQFTGFTTALAIAGAFNIAADYTQNVRLRPKTKVLPDDDQTPPPPAP